MLKTLATFVTIVAALMTAVASWDRGGTSIDKALLVAMSVVIVLAVHLLPALSRRPAAWLVWAGCLLCAVYGHLTFLTHASVRAGEAMAQHSAQTVGTQNQVEIVREALSHIVARPQAEVAAELAQTSDKRLRSSLNIEIAQAKKAEALRDELVRLSGVATSSSISNSVDPVTSKLAAFLNVEEGTVTVVIGLTFAVLLELIGAVLWVEALRPSGKKVEEVSDSKEMATVATQVTEKSKAANVTPAKSNATIPPNTNVTQSKSNVTDDAKSNVTIPVTPAVTLVKSNATTDVTPAVTIQDSNDVTPVTQNTTIQNSNEQSNATEVTNLEESNANSEHATSQKSIATVELINSLKSAIENGKCKATVRGIREFLGCGQDKAKAICKLVTQ